MDTKIKPEILIVDDEADIRGLIKGILEDEGYATRQASQSRSALEAVAESVPDLIILDIWLQNSAHDGLQILEALKKDHPYLPILMISGHGTIETAVAAIKQGAYDFIEKPFKSDRLLLLIERALEAARLRRENESLRNLANGPADLRGGTAIINNLRHNISRVAQTSSRILLTGEAGTGKNIAARMIHNLSARRHGPFIALNCAVLRPEKLERELFGSEEEGEESRGVFEQAHEGTLFLDEVADMPLETQTKIVRVLQEQRFMRLGGKEVIEVDVRIVASTNRDLEKLVQEGKFRQDLFYRLNVVPLAMPALREHPEDVQELVTFFAEHYSRQSGIPACSFSDAAIAALQAADWPGNVRQLRNIVERMMIMHGGKDHILPEELPAEISRNRAYNNLIGDGQGSDSAPVSDFISVPLREAREIFERDYLASQIRRFGGNISRTAQFVGMERSALHRKLKQLGLSTGLKSVEDEADDAAALRKSA